MIKLRFCLFVFAFLLPFGLSAQDLTNWRKPSNSELGNDFDWRKDDPNLYLMAKADYDGDGKEDEASLLINAKEGKMGLFVDLSSQPGKKIMLDEMESMSWIEAMGVGVAKPGKYKTACGKGYFECDKGEPEALNLKQSAIDYFKEGSANSFFIWEKKSKIFKRIWMSD